MLRSIFIRDFVIVEQIEINFDQHFTVFSGETGAGKSILIDALALTLGERGDATLIREGCEKTDITACFDIPESLQTWLVEQSIEGDELILRRIIDNKAKSKAFINGIPVALAQLRLVGEQLLDIHGQHAHQSLLKPTHQRDMLDQHAGLHSELKNVTQSWKQWQEAKHEAEAARDTIQQQSIERDKARWQFNELNELALLPNEWQIINEEYNRLAHADNLLDAAASTLQNLDENDHSVLSRLHSACQAISQLANKDPKLNDIFQALDSAYISAKEAASDLRNYLEDIELDPKRLELVEKRMRTLYDCARKFHIEPEELEQLQNALSTKLQALDSSLDIDALEKKVKLAQDHYVAQAQVLSQKRQAAALNMSAEVTLAMQTLAMKGGCFDIQISPAEPSAHGIDKVEFLLAGHPGVSPRPLNKVASGGELARISLAISVIASQATRVPTLIFDEVDTGVGGAVAEVVGQLLKSLGQRHQVLCVTHLPQVAACADHHFLVNKSHEEDRTISQINALSTKQRIEELARMLGGVKITETTRKHAKELLQSNAV